MANVTRRDLMVSAGVIGLTGLGTRQGNAEEEAADAGKQWSPVETLNRLKLSDEQYKKSGAMPNLELVPAALAPSDGVKVKEVNLDPEVIDIKDARNQSITTALQWTCQADVINQFAVGGTPFVARRFTYSVRDISWQAGDGWPVYSGYCPRGDYHTGMWYRHAKMHQVVPSIKGQNYFTGCLSSAICESANPGQVCFAVNDGGGDYGDNRGTFVVLITNWS